MEERVAYIGFGEAAQAFAGADGWSASTTGFDLKTLSEGNRQAKLAEFAACRVAPSETLADALGTADCVISVVTADQALAAAEAATASLRPDSLYLDFNSVAPETKCEAARLVARAGAHYVDVAVMAPVHPKRLATPLLLSGEQAERAAHCLTRCGFTDLRTVGADVGRASTIKMIRSIMIKGAEALTACCALAASRAGVLDEITTSLGSEWESKVDYNLDRMLTHGQRRAAEMDEVVKTLAALSLDPGLAASTAAWQRLVAAANPGQVPETLSDKLALIAELERAAAE